MCGRHHRSRLTHSINFPLKMSVSRRRQAKGKRDKKKKRNPTNCPFFAFAFFKSGLKVPFDSKANRSVEEGSDDNSRKRFNFAARSVPCRFTLAGSVYCVERKLKTFIYSFVVRKVRRFDIL